MRLLLPALAALALALAACDFTPTLDVPLPEFAPGLTLNGVLAADSTVEVHVTAAADPFGPRSGDAVFVVPDGAAAELLRDGASLGPLRLDSEACEDHSSWEYTEPGDGPPTYECGSFVSNVVVEPGRTYTVRASAPGFPEAEATVTVPARTPVSVTAGEPVERPLANDGKRLDTDLTVTFRDPPGPGQRYALLVIGAPVSYSYESSGCRGYDCTPRDTTVTVYVPRPSVGYTTTDPVLLAAARTVPSTGTHFITFADDEFDGTERSFAVRAQEFWYPSYDGGEPEPPVGVWVASADAATFAAYQIAWFSGGADNPFAEPVDLPSNVVGGYGLLGAVTINEARLPGAP